MCYGAKKHNISQLCWLFTFNVIYDIWSFTLTSFLSTHLDAIFTYAFELQWANSQIMFNLNAVCHRNIRLIIEVNFYLKSNIFYMNREQFQANGELIKSKYFYQWSLKKVNNNLITAISNIKSSILDAIKSARATYKFNSHIFWSWMRVLNEFISLIN